MIIATYNIQNIFHRDRALIKKYREENRELWIEEFERLMVMGMRTNKEFNRLRTLSKLLGFEDAQNGPYLTMVHKAGHCCSSHTNTTSGGWRSVVALGVACCINTADAIFNFSSVFGQPTCSC